MGFPKTKFISQQEYLDSERLTLDKHEYFRGKIVAMSGTLISHNIISMNCSVSISNKLNGKKCKPFGNNLRII